MKFFTIVFIITITSVFAIPANAQMMGGQHNSTNNEDESNQRTMMQGGMMQGRMMQGGMMQGGMMQGGMMQGGMMQGGNPMMRSMMMINMLPNMTEVLNLTEDQQQELTRIKNNFLKKRIDYNSIIEKKNLDMQDMFENNASPEQVRNALKEMANVRINMMVEAYETANQMKNILTLEQKQMLKKWKNKNMMNEMMMDRGGH